MTDAFPYFAWISVRDSRASEEHQALERHGLNGTNVYRKGDPLFAPWFEARRRKLRPCRCATIDITIEKAARMGVVEAQQWLKTGNPPVQQWARPLKVDPFANDSRCELFGWGNRHSGYNDDDYREHPGNPDRWLREGEETE